MPNVLVLSLGAPINFMNSRFMLDQLDAVLAATEGGCRLLVLEANGVVGIDFTGAELFVQKIKLLRSNGLQIAIARLESVSAGIAAERTGLIAALGPDRVFQSVSEAVSQLQPAVPTPVTVQNSNGVPPV